MSSVDDINLGILARGPKGDPGPQGPAGSKGDKGDIGVNLLTGTTDNLGTAQVIYYNSGFPKYGVDMVCSTDTTFTASAWLHPYSHPIAVQIVWLDANNVQHYSSSDYINAGSSGYSTCTVTIPAGGTLSYVTAVFNTVYNDTTQVDYKEFKLEKGIVVTDWYPNPSEILTKSDYKKNTSFYCSTRGDVGRRNRNFIRICYTSSGRREKCRTKQ